MRHSRTFALTWLGGLMLAASLAGGAAAGVAGSTARQCPAGQVSRGGTCLPGDSEEFVARQVADALGTYKLTAAMAGVWVDGERVSTAAAGETMTGYPATADMRFRIGSVAIPYMTTELLKLVDEGRVTLDDKLSRWRPDLPHAGDITLRMLASASSGYADYVTDKGFIAELYKNPFRRWTGEELVRIAMARPMARPPGSGFAYSHANWVLLGDIISRVEQRPLGEVMRENVLEPMGLTRTDISSGAEIPAPVLHAFDNERGVFEDSTYWDPSWTVAEGAVMTGTLEDMAKSFAAIGEGKLLTPESHAAQLAPVVRVKGNAWFALGLPVENTWIVQNPSFAGYAGTVACLPSRKLAIATVATQGRGSTVQNASSNVLAAIAAHLAPERPLDLG
ncbi:serine hydrolase domain-containing protein [Streptomyces sp. NRRL F-2664]|uniref:serine hydrolase domain-containing protein n=1 Tax=Streptomyces sp. NRRL F-2664 TaxID=1463842 RepID=UPI00068D9BA6|nr:serine hydrolase domain-containing protein [Streptomyces sp. NRRL F-2664]